MTSSVVQLDGDLDFSRKAELDALLGAAEHADIAIVDFERVTYLDSSVLGSLMMLKKHMVEHGTAGVVRIAGANESLRRIFAICGLDRIFELYDSAVQAQAMQTANTPGRRE
ncbi:MAG TPA: STAS domain-containing protein [Candidatus Rubrimentiphilum sp.]|nr:STAS domain-containing protein [Candidatus Rubrimentiphilum sp.]